MSGFAYAEQQTELAAALRPARRLQQQVDRWASRPQSSPGQGNQTIQHWLRSTLAQGALGPSVLRGDPAGQPRIGDTTNWRFDTYRLTASDLDDPEMVQRLQALTRQQMILYREKVADQAVKDYLTELLTQALSQVLAEQTSYERSLGRHVGAAPLSLAVGDVNVTIKPDIVDETLTSAAHTGYKLPDKISWVSGKTTGKITSLTYRREVWIQTAYLPTASPLDPSGYGRGTTEADVKAGQTSLGFHEGTHVQDILQYLAANPLPKFEGKKGDDKAKVEKLAADYVTALREYDAKMKAHLEAVGDCVGTPAAFCSSIPSTAP